MRALNPRSAFLGPILTIALVASGCEAPSYLIFVGMIQQRGGARRPNVRSIAHRLTYQAIIEPLAEMEKNE